MLFIRTTRSLWWLAGGRLLPLFWILEFCLGGRDSSVAEWGDRVERLLTSVPCLGEEPSVSILHFKSSAILELHRSSLLLLLLESGVCMPSRPESLSSLLDCFLICPDFPDPLLKAGIVASRSFLPLCRASLEMAFVAPSREPELWSLLPLNSFVSPTLARFLLLYHREESVLGKQWLPRHPITLS